MQQCWLLFLIMLRLRLCLGKTSIRTSLTVELKENVVIGSEVVDLNVVDGKTKLKISLLEVNGYELKYFQVNSEEKKIFTRHSIDREEFLSRKYCFNRLFCSIELHLLINDGEEYWIIPIHLLDENDHRPEFEKNEVRLRVDEDVVDGYQMIVGGAKDLDEGENGEVRYLLDCSFGKDEEKTNLLKKVQTMSNCVGMFDLLFLSEMRSETLIGFDQLSIKIVSPLSKRPDETEFHLTLLAIDQNSRGKQLSSEMKIRIEIEEKAKVQKKLKKYFVLVNTDRHERRDLGDLIEEKTKSNEEINSYQFINQTTNDLHIDRLTGRLNLDERDSNDKTKAKKNRSYLIQIISTSMKTQRKKTSLVELQLFPRRLELLNDVWLRSVSSFVADLSSISIDLNEIRFVSSIDFVVENRFYPDDDFDVENLNEKELFRIERRREKRNFFAVKFLHFSDLKTNEIYRLNLRIEHRQTKQILNNRIIDIQLRSSPATLTTISTSTSTSPPSWKGFQCVKEKNYFLRDEHQRSFALITILQTTSPINISSSSSSSMDLVLMETEENRFFIDQCPIELQFNFTADLSTSQLCSDESGCLNITFVHRHPLKSFLSPWSWPSSSSMVVMLSYFFAGLVLVLSMIIVVVLLCHLKSFSSCLRVKNYLFYGKKYQLSQIQRRSTSKINSRIHSIVIKESEPSSPVSREGPPQENPSLFHINLSSSFSFEEKSPDLLDIVSSSSSSFPHFDGSRLASDV